MSYSNVGVVLEEAFSPPCSLEVEGNVLKSSTSTIHEQDLGLGLTSVKSS